MNAQEKAQSWKMLEQMVDRIVDPVLRRSMLGELAARARMEWGYCPSDKDIPEVGVQLEDWQREFLDDLKVGLSYGFVPHNEEMEKENRLWMLRFVWNGGSLSEIPDDVRCEYVDKLYWECLKKYGDDLMIAAENLALQNMGNPV